MAPKTNNMMSVGTPKLWDDPTCYMNSGGPMQQPFAVIELGSQLQFYLSDIAHARKIAAVFTQAVELLQRIEADTRRRAEAAAEEDASPGAGFSSSR